jgi:serine/threonine protein kinase
MIIFLKGYEPFYGETDAELVNANKNAKDVDFPKEDWCSISSDAIDLVRCMMDPNPASRCNVKDAVKHPWFTKMLSKSSSINNSSLLSRSLLQSEQPMHDTSSATGTIKSIVMERVSFHDEKTYSCIKCQNKFVSFVYK